ncbi:hypothetical protein JCM8097_005696 [Rhodosporidiobolus ruineniae]
MPATLLTLPVVLVEHIVLLSVPPDHAVSAYKARYATLKSLCTTSKALRAVAEPMLLSFIQLPPPLFSLSPYTPFLRLLRRLADNPHQAKHVRMLCGANIQPLLKDLTVIPNLAELRVVCSGLTAGKQNLSAIASAANLTQLTLREVKLPRIKGSLLVFPHLRALTLFPDLTKLWDFFQTTSFPELRALYTCAVDWTGQSNNLRSDAPKLEMLQVEHSRTHRTTPIPLTGCPVLLSFKLTDDPAGYADFQHYHLDSTFLSPYKRQCSLPLTSEPYEGNLVALVRFIATVPCLRSFSLPFEFHPSCPLDPGRQQRRNKLVQALEDRNVKIIWRLNSKDWTDDLAVNREFWQYAKELRTRKALEADEAATSGSA